MHRGWLVVGVTLTAWSAATGCGSRTAALDDLLGGDSGTTGASSGSGGSSSGSSSSGGSSGSSSGSVAVDSGACSGGESLCMGSCVNEQTDPANCGGCDVACGGTCAMGRCLVTLASGPTIGNGLAVDGTNVYWTNDTDGLVMSVPVGGGTPRVLASNQAGAQFIAADGTSVYWITNDGLMKLPAGGGATPVTLASGGFVDLAVDAGTVYLTNPAAGTINSVPSAGGPVTTLASGPWSPLTIAVDAANVYWMDASSGSAMKVPVHGGPVVTLSAASSMPPMNGVNFYGIAALPLPVAPGQTAQSVYFSREDNAGNSNAGWLLSVPTSGGSAVTLTSINSVPGKFFTVDDASMYWLDVSGVMSMPSGGGVPVTLVTSPGVNAIAVDATSLYWFGFGGQGGQGNTLMKLTPK
jgi:hypothetical protein